MTVIPSNPNPKYNSWLLKSISSKLLLNSIQVVTIAPVKASSDQDGNYLHTKEVEVVIIRVACSIRLDLKSFFGNVFHFFLLHGIELKLF